MLEVSIHKRLTGFHLNVAFTTNQELVVLFGPSGAGKSLTLQAIAGTVSPDTGHISIDGQQVYDSTQRINLLPQQRRVGYVPQHYALFPHLTAAGNIGFGLLHRPKHERAAKVQELLALFGLQGLEHRRPRELSGGQQQRVALARALAVDPRLLLLDEPFSALDATLRESLRQELLQIQARTNITVLVVTHDLTDAFALGQRVIIYDAGKVIQQGTREEVFFHPATRRVAEFVGTGNILPTVVERVEQETLWVRWQKHVIAVAPKALAPGASVYLCVRPTQILLVRPDRLLQRERENVLQGRIVNERMERETYTLHWQLDDSDSPYDLEIVLPAYVYHRLSLDTEKDVMVELRRQVLHLVPLESEGVATHPAKTKEGNAMATLPRFAQLPLVGQTSERHAWDVFGRDDQLGTINLITAEHVKRATSLVRSGKVINLDLPLNFPFPLYGGFRAAGYRHHIEIGRGSRDDYVDNLAMQGSSQWDSLRHIRFREFGYYGGRQDEDLDNKGQLGVENWARRGIIGRGVLLDAAGYMERQGTPFDATKKFAMDGSFLEKVAAAQKVKIESGDIVLLRTGWLTWYKTLDEAGREKLRGTLRPGDDGMACPGLDPHQATAAWIWDHQIAAMASDNVALEVLPVDPAIGFQHRRLIALQGMPIGEVWDLDELAHECARDSVYEFMLTSSPLNLPGGVGSPPNAYAIK